MCVLRTPVLKVGWRTDLLVDPFRRFGFPDHDNAVFVGIGQRTQQDGFDEREHRRRAANAKRQRQDEHRGKPWLPAEEAKGVRQIVQHGRHHRISLPRRWCPRPQQHAHHDRMHRQPPVAQARAQSPVRGVAVKVLFEIASDRFMRRGVERESQQPFSESRRLDPGHDPVSLASSPCAMRIVAVYERANAR